MGIAWNADMKNLPIICWFFFDAEPTLNQSPNVPVADGQLSDHLNDANPMQRKRHDQSYK